MNHPPNPPAAGTHGASEAELALAQFAIYSAGPITPTKGAERKIKYVVQLIQQHVSAAVANAREEAENYRCRSVAGLVEGFTAKLAAEVASAREEWQENCPGCSDYQRMERDLATALKERDEARVELNKMGDWKKSSNTYSQQLHEVGDLLCGRKNNGYIGADILNLAKSVLADLTALQRAHGEEVKLADRMAKTVQAWVDVGEHLGNDMSANKSLLAAHRAARASGGAVATKEGT